MPEIPQVDSKLILIDDILIDDDFNCRGSIAPIDVADLADSIQKEGLLQPIVVSELKEPVEGKKYKLIAGFRRTYTMIMLGKKEIPAVIKVNMDDADARILNLTENLVRQQLTIQQEAQALQKLLDHNPHFKYADIQKRLGVTSMWVNTRMSLLKLPAEIQAESHLLTVLQIQRVAREKAPEKQFELVKKIKVAKEKGEDPNLVLPERKKPKPHEKRSRKPKEILDCITDIIAQCGDGNLATRALAWAMGNVSDDEFTVDLKNHDPKFQGFNYGTAEV